jgi:alcohol dehydrogenase class IV
LIDILLENDIKSYVENSKTRIVFGWEKSLEIRSYIDRVIRELQQYLYIGDQVFLLIDRSLTETDFYSKFIKKLGNAEVFPCECQNPGLMDLAEVFAAYRKSRQRIVVGVGGGSIMDLAKAIAGWAYHPGFIPAFPRISEGLPCYPLILIPTMAGTGSEVTPYIFMTDKQGCRVINGLVPPYISIVDPWPSLTSMHYQTLYASMTAFAHSIEALVSKNATPETDKLAFRAIELILINLPKVLKNKGHIEGRTMLSLASVLAGLSAKAGLGLAACMALQIHNIPYGLILSLVLPFVIEYNEALCREKYEIVNNLFIYRGEELSGTIQNWFNYLGVYSFDGIYRKNLEMFLHSEYCIRLSAQLVMDNIHYVTNPAITDEEAIKNLFFSLHTIPLQAQKRYGELMF